MINFQSQFIQMRGEGKFVSVIVVIVLQCYIFWTETAQKMIKKWFSKGFRYDFQLVFVYYNKCNYFNSDMLIIEASEQPISIVQLTLIKSTSEFLSDWLNYFGMSTVNVDFKFSRHSFWSALIQTEDGRTNGPTNGQSEVQKLLAGA